jgi:hypothetical protein
MPILKFDAKEGLLYAQDRVQGSDGKWETEQRDHTKYFRAIMDLDNILVGWICFPKGDAPQCVLVPLGDDYGEQPSKEHKEGLRLLVKIEGDVVRELLSVSVFFWEAIDQLHSEFEAASSGHPRELPVVELAEVIEHKAGGGKVYAPRFEIAGWAPRPKDLPAKALPRRQPPPKQAVKDDMADVLPKDEPPPPRAAARNNGGIKRGDMDDEIPF